MKINFPLLALAIGAFGIGTTEFSPMGLLPVIAKGVDVSIPVAGMLISAYAIGVMVGAGSTSSMDSLPHDETTVDLPGVESYNSSFEWGDADNFTAPFARIGN